jgi:hypothetical protein
MRLVRRGLAVFRGNGDLVARFVPAPRAWRSGRCE